MNRTAIFAYGHVEISPVRHIHTLWNVIGIPEKRVNTHYNRGIQRNLLSDVDLVTICFPEAPAVLLVNKQNNLERKNTYVNSVTF